MKKAISLFYFMLMFCSLTAQRKVNIHVDSANQGKFCYLIWTTDSLKCNPKSILQNIHLDKKNVAYVHIDMINNSDSVRIFNSKGENISDHMISIMKTAEYLYFYFPTDNEYKLHPHYDSYYVDKLQRIPNYSPFLEKLGYKIEHIQK